MPYVSITTIETKPIDGQNPGMFGLRKKTKVFLGAHYLENFVQVIFDGIGGVAGKRLVVGGDGRFHNDVAVKTVLRIVAANDAARVIVGHGGLLSTPAASHLIRVTKPMAASFFRRAITQVGLTRTL
jgi:phosphoglucomutase